jgi:hypothetical protein
MGTVRVPGPLTRLARRHGFTRSSLRRSTDRVEAAQPTDNHVALVLAQAVPGVVHAEVVCSSSTPRQSSLSKLGG